jgi:ribonuclease D
VGPPPTVRRAGGETRPSPSLEAIGTAATRLTAAADDRPTGLPATLLAPQRARLRPERTDEVTDPVGDALESWRRSRAKAADVAPEHVLSDEALAAIVATRPQSVDDIAALVEIGPIRASRWAPFILEVVDRALDRPGA